MKAAKFPAAILLVLSLTGAVQAPIEGPSPRDPYPIENPKPKCLGKNGHYHVWNLFSPQDVYQVDSCVAAQLVAARNQASNYALYISLLMGRIPAFVPFVVYVMAWHTGSTALANCASKGTGVEFIQDSKTGTVLYCRAQ